MANYQVAWNATTKVATIQALGDSLPAGSTNIGSFDHSGVADIEGPDVSHVMFHHVRDLLYHQGVEDMQSLSMVEDTTYVALTAITIAPATVTLAVLGTQQLTITKTPAGATNGSIASWTSTDATKATVSSTGLVTAVATGTTTITATSVDGARVATRLVTVS